MVRKSSMELTTTLRIIERSDEDCLAKQKQTGFLPPGRPKWREVCMDKLGQSVNQKMEGNLLEGGRRTRCGWSDTSRSSGC
jgi:exocyst complex component 3